MDTEQCSCKRFWLKARELAWVCMVVAGSLGILPLPSCRLNPEPPAQG